MIPKIIHWCWLSNDPIPESLKQCMDTWQRYLPDYKFMHWNFDRFPRGKSKWVDEAFDNKKYAFAADYIRLYALYNYGGIYLDMDVEVCKSFDPFCKLPQFLCWQNEMDGLEVAAFGAEKHSSWIAQCLASYENKSFVKSNGKFDMKVLPSVVEDALRSYGYALPTVNSIEEAEQHLADKVVPVFPFEFFSPKSYKTGVVKKTDKTVCIHHFAGSWLTKDKLQVFEENLWKRLGVKNLNIYGKIVWNIVKPIKKLLKIED